MIKSFGTVTTTVCLAVSLLPAVAAQPLQIDSPMDPPDWAFAQWALLDSNVEAASLASDRYVDSRGWCRITPNWGAADGADDVTETYRDLPMIYMLGGSPKILALHNKIYEGHLDQYTEAREPLVAAAKDGMMYREFCPQLDWEHTGEAMVPWYWHGLASPRDPRYLRRARRYAGFYMDEDPEARNYDPEQKLIRSLFNGSRGPLMTIAKEYEWGGHPRPRHDPRPGQLPRTERWTRLGYTVSLRGDHPQNLLTTNLAMTAYMLTGETKYRDWILEYADAWVERAEKNGGNLPSNIGLDGSIGGEWDGKWWGGVYGWNFRPKSDDGTENPGNNYVMRGARIGFGIAFLLTGNHKYINTLRKQIDNMYDQKKVIDGRVMVPHKYGENGWYAYIDNSVPAGGNVNFWSIPELTDIYTWTLDDSDLPRIAEEPWVQYSRGQAPDFPMQAIAADFAAVRSQVQKVREDTRTTDTRGSSDMPVVTSVTSLINLMLGANDPGSGGNVLHAQVRYFDAEARRPGLPRGVGALVERIGPEGITLVLVNTNPVADRRLVVQSGAYAEHEFVNVSLNGNAVDVGDSQFTVHLGAGAGARLSIQMNRYVNPPTFTWPWNR
ncbi:MAG: hypothetical protein MK110_07165 [Fuerstiella sp.]|nr:hypothetical protein [Fuerstiella sp.]